MSASYSLLEQINEVQVYPSKLLLLLGKYDKATSLADKIEASQLLRNYVDSFNEIGKNYEDDFFPYQGVK